MRAKGKLTQDRRGIHEPDQRLDGPHVLTGELEPAVICEASAVEHLTVRAQRPGLLPSCRDPVGTARAIAPVDDHLLQLPLPRFLTVGGHRSPEQCDGTVVSYQLAHPLCDDRAVKPMKCGAD